EQAIITPGEKPPPRAFVPVEAIAADHIVLPCQRQHGTQFAEVELAVGVGEGHQIQAPGLKAASQGCAITTIMLMSYEPYARIIPSRAGRDSGGAVAAAVIPDYDFVIERQRR